MEQEVRYIEMRGGGQLYRAYLRRDTRRRCKLGQYSLPCSRAILGDVNLNSSICIQFFVRDKETIHSSPEHEVKGMRLGGETSLPIYRWLVRIKFRLPRVDVSPHRWAK